MKPLTSNDVESELSYAYVHAVAAKAGMGCEVSGRHNDNAGVDARLTAWGPFPNGGYLEEVDLNIQLKATISEPADDGDCYSYFLRGTERYDDLRTTALSTPRILVVLFLPRNPDEWVCLDEEQLSLRRCAYWVSLRGASSSANGTGVTVKIPKRQIFNHISLAEIVRRLSHNDIPAYEAQ